jgi:hypothetical protein
MDRLRRICVTNENFTLSCIVYTHNKARTEICEKNMYHRNRRWSHVLEQNSQYRHAWLYECAVRVMREKKLICSTVATLVARNVNETMMMSG